MTMEWQDISTAPKDGTRVLLTDGLNTASVGFWRRTYEEWHPNEMTEINWWRMQPPTHWMPLPKPPKDGK